MAPAAAFVPPPTIQSGGFEAAAAAASGAPSAAAVDRVVKERLAISHLTRAYQVRGHEVSKLDPLNIANRDISSIPELDYRSYGFTESDLDRTFDVSGIESLTGFQGKSGAEGADVTKLTLRELLTRLQSTFCGRVGWEYMHITSREKCNWLRERIEVANPKPFSKEKTLQVFDRLAFSSLFESYLANKFNTAKRFGLEGCENLIPGLKAMVDRATELGVESMVFGMPHRGRLNVLVNVIRKPMENLLREFLGTHISMDEYNHHIENGDWSGSGDVKYHLGTSYDRTYDDGRKVHLALMANPSHLEAVNPLVSGKVRAKQDSIGDKDGSKVAGVMLHGDAAFAGQGIVYETFLLSQLENYKTGGTIHVICNNQVGFTTDPTSSRSTLYTSDLGKAFDVPIFHVNADDAEAVTRVFEIATEYRQTFKTDVIIDLIGYRKHGHNELDQPMFTQPKMYSVIAKHPPALEIYKKEIINRGVATEEELNSIIAKVNKVYADAWEKTSEAASNKEDWLSGNWKNLQDPCTLSKPKVTGVPMEALKTISSALTNIPSNIRLHSSLVRIFKAKEESLKSGANIDWATAEALAFGSLLLEGTRVRLSGQDVERGTFSHRHAVVHDQDTNALYCPLSNISDKQAPFLATNSPLSEFGVMGFELGYSMENPNQLILWEAQFGDFVNGAQIIIDQFLSAGESKWYRQSGLTLLLPHGYEGQGPEHSSCRIERFLQLMDDQEDVFPTMEEDKRMQIQRANMQVLNCTTPANYFHALRRQVHRDFRKPLIVATPKSLLRHKSAVSTLDDMSGATTFQRVIPDVHSALKKPEEVRKIVFCTGKVYYDLDKHRMDNNINDVAIARVEQIAPFPFDLVAEELKKYPNAEVVWAQEEPRNMGAWTYVAPRIRTAAGAINRDVDAKYIGRLACASPAVGSTYIHDKEQAKLVEEALQ